MTDDTHNPNPAPAPTPVADVSGAPLPTDKTLRMRRNLPYQATRFAVFNLRIMRMVRKAHH